jgi:hypothetical protein
MVSWGKLIGGIFVPLRDHFHPPVEFRLPWPSLHSGWIGTITERLNDLMPPEYVALDRMWTRGGLEIDIAAVEEDLESTRGVDGVNGHGAGGTAVATVPAVYTPPAATGTVPFDFPDVAEVRIFSERGERKLVGAVELVSPGNKDRDAKRVAFVAKCLDYLASGVCVVIVDVVTNRQSNLHNEMAQQLGASPSMVLPDESPLYAASYRPVIRENRPEIDIWVNAFAVGDPLPTMPLRLIADYFVPVELELTYTEACRRRRLLP